MKTYKKLYLSIGISGIVVLFIGFVALALGIIGDPKLSEQETLLLKVFGSCGAIIGVILTIFGVSYFFKSRKGFIIEEKDERNIAIRGKTAQLTCLIMFV